MGTLAPHFRASTGLDAASANGTPSSLASDRGPTDEFNYLTEKIAEAEFDPHPFPHIVITDFLSDQHFESVTRCQQVDLAPQPSTEALIETMLAHGYRVESFPGCTTNIADYIRCLSKDRWPVDKRKLEGYGMVFRLQKIEDPTVARLVSFLGSAAFKSALEAKFAVTRPTRIDTAIQKYLSGYEISPHPDIRSKCLTYLININPDESADGLSVHTRLLKFKPEWEFIYLFWEKNPGIDRCWVPWDWCTVEKTISPNNSIVAFATSDQSLHAVKLRYDHTRFQRTQIYGNLWHTDVPYGALASVEYNMFDIQGRGRRAPAPTALKSAKNLAIAARNSVWRRWRL